MIFSERLSSRDVLRKTRFGLVYQIYRLLRRAALFVVTGAHVAGADKQAEGTAV
jgi:hypothetical protein